MKPIKKIKVQGFRTTEQEKQMIVLAALTAKKAPAEFARDIVIEKAKEILAEYRA